MKSHSWGTALLGTALVLSACGGDAGTADPAATSAAPEAGATEPDDPTAATEGPADTTAEDGTTPVGASEVAPPAESVDDLLAEAESENALVVYGNPSDRVWEPVLAAFSEAYPSIEVETFDLGGLEAFQRYLSEASSGVATADMIVASESDGWLDLVDRGEVLDYRDPQLNELPEYALQAPGVYAMAVDPVVAMYNQFIIPPEEQPTSLAELAEMAPNLDGNIGTVEVENSLAYTATYGYVTANEDAAWETFDAIGEYTQAESGAGALLDKATSGEYPASFFVSGAVRIFIDTAEQGEVLDYQYLTDATPLVPRGMGIAAGADSPASAKLFINWLLSADGQAAACLGGLAPYRPGVECKYGYGAIAEVVGEDNMIVVNYAEDASAQRDQIQARWNEVFGR